MPIVTTRSCSDDRHVAEEHAGEQAQSHPRQRAPIDVVEHERRGRHLRRPGDERHERPDDRHEPAEDDRLAAVLLEERVRAGRVTGGSSPGASRLPSSVAVKMPRADPPPIA
jgi:hypothetical protein